MLGFAADTLNEKKRKFVHDLLHKKNIFSDKKRDKFLDFLQVSSMLGIEGKFQSEIVVKGNGELDYGWKNLSIDQRVAKDAALEGGTKKFAQTTRERVVEEGFGAGSSLFRKPNETSFMDRGSREASKGMEG